MLATSWSRAHSPSRASSLHSQNSVSVILDATSLDGVEDWGGKGEDMFAERRRTQHLGTGRGWAHRWLLAAVHRLFDVVNEFSCLHQRLDTFQHLWAPREGALRTMTWDGPQLARWGPLSRRDPAIELICWR